MGNESLNILGKDYLTEKEAADYCGVSLSYFRKQKKNYGIMSGRFGTKKLYRKIDLQQAIESEFTGLTLPR